MKHDVHDPPQGNPPIAGRGPPDAPREEAAALKDNFKSGSYLGTTKRLPEFNLNVSFLNSVDPDESSQKD